MANWPVESSKPLKPSMYKHFNWKVTVVLAVVFIENIITPCPDDFALAIPVIPVVPSLKSCKL